MKKRFLAIIATLALAVAFAVPTFAAGTITAKEQALLDRFAAGVNGIKPSASYVAQARNVLLEDDLTDAQIAQLNATIDSVTAQIKASGATTNAQLKALPVFDSLVAEVEGTLAAVGYKVSYNATGVATIKTATGKTIAPSNVRQTGFDMTATVVSALALVGVLSAGAVVISKKELLAD